MDETGIIITTLICALIIGGIVWFAIYISKLQKNGKANAERQKQVEEDFLRETEITHSVDYEWNNPNDSESRVRFIADDQARKIYLFVFRPLIVKNIQKQKEIEEIPYDEILKFEISENKIDGSNNGVSRAIVGGVLAGGVGAIVGAQTAKTKEAKVVSLTARIYLKGINRPQPEFLVGVEGKAFLYNVEVKIKEILTKGNGMGDSVQGGAPSASADLSARLKALKTAYDEGLLTEKEYNDKRSDILKSV